MEIVIKIPENSYKATYNGCMLPPDVENVVEAIKNGTPLPEKHGRLKDVDAFITKVKEDRKHSAYLRSWTADDVLSALDNSYAPTIIEGSDVG